MEKIFIQSVLFSTAILVVYAFVSPPAHLSAQSSPELDPSVHVRKGIVSEINVDTSKLVVSFDGVSVPVAANASTTVTSSNGEETELAFLRDGSSVYVFGHYDIAERRIQAEKIVMRNRSVLERKSLSRAEEETVNGAKRRETSSILRDVGLTTR